MGERKVLNKYIPADFDPRLVPRGTRPKDDMVPVRMMLPFSIQCSSCSSFMYRGRKFNSKKEPMRGQDGKYLGIQRYRFYIKCTVCSRPVTFLTDPKNADYEMETGATRNYEVWHDKERTNEEVALEKEMEEKADPMKALENRVLESQREMADLDNLDEIKAMNMRHLQMMSATGSKGAARGPAGFDDAAKAVLMAREVGSKQVEEELNENGLTASEEKLVKSIKFGKQSSSEVGESTSIRRLDEDDEEKFEKKRRRDEAMLQQQQLQLTAKATGTGDSAPSAAKSIVPVIKVKRKRPVVETALKKKPKTDVEEAKNSASDGSDAEGGLGGLLGAYGSDSDSD